MYKFFLLAVIVFLTSSFGQKIKKSPVKEIPELSYPIAGSDLLQNEFLRVAKFLKENPDYLNKLKLQKPSAWNFTNGDKKTWFTYDYTTGTNNNPVLSTCKAVGTHCYIFVADDAWGTYVDSTAVLAVMNDFDNQTPADPSKGIYQMDVETFGNPPDEDNDPKIIILILDIKDGYTGTGGYVAGYFHPENELRIGGQAAEIYFMDANPTNLKTSEGINNALSTAAHEFQHMINFNYHFNFNTGDYNPELTFINEGLSMVAEIICGYGASMQSLYAGEPNHYLFDWRTDDNTLVLNDYARAQRFFLYIKEQLGINSLKEITQDHTSYGLVGISALQKIFSNYSTSLGEIFLNWEIANGLNNLSVHPAYGYSYQPIPLTTGNILYNPNVNPTAGTLKNLGAEYFTYSKSSNLNVTFSSSGNNIIIKAIEIGDGGSRVVDVPLNTPFIESDYPVVYNTIRFAAVDTNENLTQDYQYQSNGISSGVITELKWDNTEPIGYYSWTPNDTLCVTFDPIIGGRLDSIKVALRRAGSINGGVWEYTGRSNPTPLGKKLAFPITAAINTTTSVPYPVPYGNWATIDLRSFNISTDKSFAIGFIIGSDPSTPGVMATDYASSSPYHSYTYLQTSDDVSSPGWYFITTNGTGDTIAIYLIRAYVSLITGTGKEEIELAPAIYSLSQNYPNPFNPSTNIKYQIAKDGFVLLKIYDVLGNEVKTLVNEYKNSGNYNVKFDAAGLAAGIYFYRIQAGSFTEVKKLMLLK